MLASAAYSASGSFTPSDEPRPLLYRRFFTATECKALDSFPPETALSEINLIRILLARSMAAARSASKGKRIGLGRCLSMLTAFSHAALIIASLVRFQERYFGWASMGDPALAALAEMDPYDL